MFYFIGTLREKKNGAFYVISSFVPEIFKFLHYANWITDDVISGSSMKLKHKIKNIWAP